MDLGLKERVAIVGGSSRGIGRAIAIAFAKEGASVTICARHEEGLRRTEIELARISSQHHVLAIPADLSAPRDIRRVVRDTFNRFDQIGILVTHVGNLSVGTASEFEDEEITEAMDRNFYSAVRLSREVIPYMRQQHWGRIINLLSMPAQQATDGMALSAASQLAMVGYFKMLANELAPFNITVNNVVSGSIHTEAMASILETQAQEHGRTPEELVKETAAAIPMRRMGKPEEVGDLVAFLASERSGYLTGTSVVVDGGLLQSMR
ncbi:MAG: SDR family oxidoreductase [Dehalococcoidia bacterium]